MSPKLKNHYKIEIQNAKQNMSKGEVSAAWDSLARAHILGQFYVIPHLEVHWLMFILAIKTKNPQEFFGQIPRLILATPGSVFKKAPKGNTGLSNVGIFQPMQIPEDLQKIITDSK